MDSPRRLVARGADDVVGALRTLVRVVVTVTVSRGANSSSAGGAVGVRPVTLHSVFLKPCVV